MWPNERELKTKKNLFFFKLKKNLYRMHALDNKIKEEEDVMNYV